MREYTVNGSLIRDICLFFPILKTWFFYFHALCLNVFWDRNSDQAYKILDSKLRNICLQKLKKHILRLKNLPLQQKNYIILWNLWPRCITQTKVNLSHLFSFLLWCLKHKQNKSQQSLTASLVFFLVSRVYFLLNCYCFQKLTKF